MYNVYMSPVVIRIAGLKWKINVDESTHTGRPHVHVEGADGKCSIDLISFEVLANRGFDKPTLNEICKLTELRVEQLMKKWNEYHEKEQD
jgi:hypothetical protein